VRKNILQPLGMFSTDFAYTEGMRPQAATGYQPRWSLMTLLLRFMLQRGIVGRTFGGYVAFRPFYVNGAPFGGLLGSVGDAARFAAVHLNGGVVNGTRVLAEKSVTESNSSLIRVQRLTWASPGFESVRTRGAAKHSSNNTLVAGQDSST
jgi:CubicO group peptidase (beta-lactamase class C family)